MTVWPDPSAEQQAQIIREIAARMLAETDPKKLSELIKVLTRVVEVQLRVRPLD
jgi:hypothetical protein